MRKSFSGFLPHLALKYWNDHVRFRIASIQNHRDPPFLIDAFLLANRYPRRSKRYKRQAFTVFGFAVFPDFFFGATACSAANVSAARRIARA